MWPKKRNAKLRKKSGEIDVADFSFFLLNSKLGHRLPGLEMGRILPFFQPKVFIDYSHKVLFKSGNCFLIIWVHLPISFFLFFLQTDELDDGIQIVPEIESCKSNYMTIFVGCIYATKGLLMVINLIFW